MSPFINNTLRSASAQISGTNSVFTCNDKQQRRPPSLWSQIIHCHCAKSSPHSSNRIVDNVFHRLYFSLRSLQSIVAHNNESSHDEVAELMKWEVNIQPPPIEELQRRTSGVFSNKWIKNCTNRRKGLTIKIARELNRKAIVEECPSGRMRIQEFKNLFGAYLPSRISNAYIHRLFFAFSRSQETLTFQELVETLAMLNSPTPLSNAHWMMRLIKGSDDGTISYTDFKKFVRSVFSETNKELRKISIASTQHKKTPIMPTTHFVDNGIDRRAEHVFSRLDRNNDGFIELEDLIDFFQREDRVDPLATCSRSARISQNK